MNLPTLLIALTVGSIACGGSSEPAAPDARGDDGAEADGGARADATPACVGRWDKIEGLFDGDYMQVTREAQAGSLRVSGDVVALDPNGNSSFTFGQRGLMAAGDEVATYSVTFEGFSGSPGARFVVGFTPFTSIEISKTDGGQQEITMRSNEPMATGLVGGTFTLELNATAGQATGTFTPLGETTPIYTESHAFNQALTGFFSMGIAGDVVGDEVSVELDQATIETTGGQMTDDFDCDSIDVP